MLVLSCKLGQYQSRLGCGDHRLGGSGEQSAIGYRCAIRHVRLASRVGLGGSIAATTPFFVAERGSLGCHVLKHWVCRREGELRIHPIILLSHAALSSGPKTNSIPNGRIAAFSTILASPIIGRRWGFLVPRRLRQAAQLA